MTERESGMSLNVRTGLAVVVCSAIVASLTLGFGTLMPNASRAVVGAVALAVSIPPIWWLVARIISGNVRAAVVAVGDGLLSLAEGDYSLRLAVERYDEIGRMLQRFNALTEVLRRERNDAFQKGILLDTVLGATSSVAVLVNEANRVVYSNVAARRFFGGGRRIDGEDLRELLVEVPREVREAVEGSGDELLFTFERGDGGEPETFQLIKRTFEISTQRHRLVLLKPLTKELARKEVDTWKKAIRVLSHELNNSLAPVTSLVHSARLLLKQPDKAPRLEAAFDTIEERTRHLRTFLDGYAGFARLPLPSRKPTAWRAVLAGVEGLYSFRVDGEVPEAPSPIDAAQIQQVLINLLKNAAEAGSPPDQVVVAFPRAEQGVEVQVLDRGRGMSDEVMRNAVLPFYSTKKAGSGLGLALCREILEAHGGRLSLGAREGGGTIVRFWLP